MRKAKQFILLLFLSFFIIFPVYAESGRIEVDDGGAIPYSYGGSNPYYTNRYRVINSNQEPLEAFCLEPSKPATSGDFSSAELLNEHISEVPALADLIKMMYYTFGQPGWHSSEAESFKTTFGLNDLSGDDLNNQYYAWSHVLLSYYYHFIKSDNGWDTRLPSVIKDNVVNWAIGQLPNYPDPPSSYKVYAITNENSQDIIFAEDTPTVCGKVIKNLNYTLVVLIQLQEQDAQKFQDQKKQQVLMEQQHGIT